VKTLLKFWSGRPPFKSNPALAPSYNTADVAMAGPDSFRPGKCGTDPATQTDRARTGLVCAWCQKEQGVMPSPHESHGICQRHKAAMLEQASRIHWRTRTVIV
jgi:hypothetical protein